MAVALAQASGLSPSPTIRPFVITTLGLDLWDLNRPSGWPDMTTESLLVCQNFQILLN